MDMQELLDSMEERLGLAKAVKTDFEKLISRRIAGYVIVDDGQDRWIANETDYETCAAEVISDILSGDLIPNPDEGYQPAYDNLCFSVECLYSRIGAPSDIDQLVDDLDCGPTEMLEILEALSLDDEDLPGVMKALHSEGPKFYGSNLADAANDWIAGGFNAETVEEWLAAGFWNASAAEFLADEGLSADDALAAAKTLGYMSSKYTDGCPIYSVCNGDTDPQVIVDEHDRLLGLEGEDFE